MPAKLRNLSGAEVVGILARFGFETVSRRGSHVKLRRIIHGEKQTLHLPLHKSMRRGTLHSIYRQALAYIPDEDLRRAFFTS